MGYPDHIDLYPEAVNSAGANTANTSSSWSGWASRSETLLRNTASGSRQATVTNAFETYLSTWNPTMRGLALRADALGTNAVSASNTIAGSDADGAALLRTQAETGAAQTSQLSRPINGAY